MQSPDRQHAVARVVAWYAHHARPLPWREPDASSWSILVSEIMLQQTPVARVLPVWESWIQRWPDPTSLADDESAEAVRAWGRLGYPRRAKRLHEAAVIMRDEHAGAVPEHLDALRALPGIGAYTAAAVAAFAFGQRQAVLDTNVRRLLARLDSGTAYASPTLTKAETRRAETWLPDKPQDAARWAAASMELGAIICTARSPRCDVCPIASACAWLQAGRPDWEGPPRRGQPYVGTDRQCRGVLLGVLRETPAGVARGDLLATWTIDGQQAERALRSLLDDGLVREVGHGVIGL